MNINQSKFYSAANRCRRAIENYENKTTTKSTGKSDNEIQQNKRKQTKTIPELVAYYDTRPRTEVEPMVTEHSTRQHK